MAGLMDFLGLGGAGAYDDLLSEEQKKRMQQQTMMTMAAKLLQAGGPSTTRTNLGQALGGAYLSGQEAYQKAGSDALTQMLTKQKIEEYKRDQNRQQLINQMLGFGQSGSPAAQTTTPAAALAMPATPSLPAGPTAARAAMIGQQPAAAAQATNPFAGLTQPQKMLMAMSKPGEMPGLAAKFMEQNRAYESQKQQTLSADEVEKLGLPKGTVVTKDAFGKYSVVNKPNIQVVQTPAGGTAVLDLDAIARGDVQSTPAVQRAAAAPAVPEAQGTTARASVARGVTPLFDPAVKPEQLITEARDWTKNYYQPVQTVIKNYNDVLELINSGSGGISDYGILIKAIKALDPTSAVMQGEADSAKNMMSLADKMSSIIKQVEAGGLGSDVAREQLANLARSSVKTAVNSYNAQLNRQKSIYSAGYMPEAAINAILAPIQMPTGAESMTEMRKQIQPAAPIYPPKVMDQIQRGAQVVSDGKGNFMVLDPATNTWKPIQ